MSKTRLLVLASLLLLLNAVSAQELPQTFLPGDAVLGAAAGNQRAPALEAGGDMLLAVWQDHRSSPLVTGEQSSDDVFAQRLDATGAPIDAVPFVVNMDGGIQGAPRVAWNGTAWLVAWVGQVSTEFYYTDALLAARVAADGTLLDPVPIVVRPDMASGTFGDVASDGNGWAVFFTGWEGAISEVYGARLAADGTLLDATPKIIFTPGGSPSTPYGVTADWAAGRYLVTWSQWMTSSDNVRGRLADAALAPVGSVFNVATSGDYEVHPEVASNGSAFYVVWDRYNTCCVGGASQAWGTRVTAAGAVQDGPVGVAIYDTDGYGFQGCEPAVSWDGTQWIASWTEPVAFGDLRVSAARISAAGLVLDFNGVPVDPASPRQEASAVIGLPAGGSLVAWQDSRAVVGQANDIYAARFDFALTSQPLGPIALAAPAQVHADAAPDTESGALLAFASMLSGSVRVLAERVTATGAPVGEPVEVAAGPVIDDVHAAWSGDGWLVTWDEPGGVFARRLDADGQPIEAQPFLVMPGFGNDVAAQGDTYLVTALVPEPNPEYVNVRSRRVSAATGAVLDGSSLLVGATYATAQSVVGFDGGFLVAWEKHATHDQPYSSVWLRLVSLDNVPGAQTSFTSTSSYNQVPALAAGGANALLVWQLGPFSSVNQEVMALVVEPGLVLPGGNITVSAAPFIQQLPQVAWDGTQYVVAWQDLRATQDYLFDRRMDIYAARVTSGGTVLDPQGLALATDAAPEGWPTVTGLGTGSALVAWSDFQEQAPFASHRLGFSLVGASPWIDLGHALAGVAGEPQLSATGALVEGTLVEMLLSEAAPVAPATLVIGLSELSAAFKGGVLVPSTDLIIAGLVTDALGEVLLFDNWPAGIPSGTTYWFQYWIDDASGPKGLSASNALKAIVP